MNYNIQEDKKIDNLVDCSNNKSIILNEEISIQQMSMDTSLIAINYPENSLNVTNEYIKKGIISCSDFHVSNEIELDEPLKRCRTNTTGILPEHNKRMEINDFNDDVIVNIRDTEYDDVDILDFLLCEQRPMTPSVEEMYKEIYERSESEDIKSSIDYDNMKFCYCCEQNLILPIYEITNFIRHHLLLNKYSKYLIIVFRLCPTIFLDYDVSENKHLKKYILDYISSKDKCEIDTGNSIFANLNLVNQYELCTRKSSNSHIFEILFHQENLKYTDYIKCDSCKQYLCPMHTYLGNCIYKKCNYCDKRWTICGWCKSEFNEEYACKYIH